MNKFGSERCSTMGVVVAVKFKSVSVVLALALAMNGGRSCIPKLEMYLPIHADCWDKSVIENPVRNT